MPTARGPIGTSLTNLFSNIRLSFAMLLSSRGPIFGRMFPRPPAQPRKPTLRFGSDAYHDHGDVVGSTALVRQIHELLCRFRGVRLGLQSARNLRLNEHAREAVRAQQQD